MIAQIFSRFIDFPRRWRLKRRVAELTPDERAELLHASAFEPYWEQGMEGEAYVVLKSERDLGAAMSGGPGLFPTLRAAEDWIIAREIERCEEP